MQEIWKEYETQKTKFYVSNLGNIQGHTINIINGRKRVAHKFVHRLVWTLFVGPIPDGYVIHHIDHNPLNNNLDNLKLMTRSEHMSHHSKGNKYCEGKHHTENTKQKIKMSNTGKKRSKESKQKMSDSHKGKPMNEKTKQSMIAAVKNTHWYNNGIENIRAFECPEGYKLGKLMKNK